MKKYFKYIILCLCIMCLFGCDAKWSEIQSQYGSVIGNGISCRYTATESPDPYGLKSIEFIASNNLQVKINDNSSYVIWDEDGKKDSIKYGKYKFDIDSFTENLLKEYANNNKCPAKFFIDTVHNRFTLDRTLLTDTSSPAYTNGKTTITDQKGEQIDCHYTGQNVNCAKYSKTEDKYGQTYYFEIGTYNNGIKYFGVSKYENYKDMQPVGIDSDGGFSLRYDNIVFQIPANAVNELWLNSGFISSGNIKINYNFFTTQICYITGPNSVPTDVGNLFEGGEVEDGPKLDPPTELEEQFGNAGNVMLPENVEGMDFCSENGVKLTLHVLGYIVFTAKLLVPLLLIIFGSIDFGKALMDSDDKAIKDSLAKLIKRTIAGIIIFFLPTIFNFAFSLIDEAVNNQQKFEQCSKCLFSPFSGECSYTKIGE